MSYTKGIITAVRRDVAGAGLAADATAGDTQITLQSVLDFNPDGGPLVMGDDDPIAYTAADVDTYIVTLAAGLANDYELGTPVAALDEDGQQAETWTIDVDLRDGGKPIPAMPDHGLIPLLQEGEPLVGTLVDVESDRSGYYIRTLPGRSPTVDGQFLAQVSVDADKLTTAAGGPDLVNGTFEDSSSLIGRPFAGWKTWYWVGPIAGSTVTAEEVDQIAGSRSLSINLADPAAGWRVRTDRIYPVSGGSEIQFTAKVRASRDVDRSTQSNPVLVELTMITGIPGASIDALFTADVVWQPIAQIDHLDAGDIVELAGSAVVPDGHTQMAFSIYAGPAADGSGWSLVADEAHMTSATTAIAAQRIETLSVGSLQVGSTDDIMIGSQTLTDWLAAHFTPVTSPPLTNTYTATALRSYDSSGALIATDTFAYTGYAESTNGNRRAAVWFDSTTIAADLAGKTISKVEVKVAVSQRPGDGPGTLPIGVHSDATVRSTYGAITGKVTNLERPGGFTPGTEKWVEISDDPTEWQSGVKKGVILGPGQNGAGTASNSLVYAMRIDGIGKTTVPQLRFTYT